MKVSIIIPVYNRQSIVGEAINSVLSQKHSDIECIVIDGGSKDGTVRVLESFGSKIKFISEKDRGVFDALNKGIKMASGELIGWLGADDIYANNEVVEKAVETVLAKDVEICWGDLLYVSKDNPDKIIRYWRSSAYKDGDYRKGWQMPHFASFVRKEVFEKYGYFREDLKIAADYELFLRFLEVNKISTFYVPEVFLKMRVGGQSNLSLKGNLECYKAWELNGLKVNPLAIFIPKILIKLAQYLRKS
ncbi:MAG TPA: glycosyltransferase family 2 protein [Methylomirabilota bacterium]|nr:glycosyltransferase family 2 protein [Methylomirabilota bacterium]